MGMGAARRPVAGLVASIGLCLASFGALAAGQTVEVAEICSGGHDCGCPEEQLCAYTVLKGSGAGPDRFTPTALSHRFTCPPDSTCPFAVVPDAFVIDAVK